MVINYFNEIKAEDIKNYPDLELKWQNLYKADQKLKKINVQAYGSNEENIYLRTFKQLLHVICALYLLYFIYYFISCIGGYVFLSII